MFSNISIIFIGTMLVCATVNADVEVPKIFGDNMVLQRNMPVPIWGRAFKGEKVEVAFAGQKKEAVANDAGKWMIKLEPLETNKIPGNMTVKGINEITFRNVLVGEVWVCSGQSNMELNVSSSLNPIEETKNANYPEIRLIKLPVVTGYIPEDNVKADWAVCSPEVAGKFSAVAYYFGRNLFKELDVPIGLISSSWGGTRIEPWIPPVGYRTIPELKTVSMRVDSWDSATEIGRETYFEFIKKMKAWIPEAEKALGEKKAALPLPSLPLAGTSHQEPTKIYNGMIAPLIPYAIRGVIWYQGESNGEEGISYFHKKKALINGWRQLWGQGDFPFYFVQLANYRQPDTNNPRGGDNWAGIREAQTKCLEIPNTGMAVTIDIGDATSIHPNNKQDVGKRLALWALVKDYKKENVFSGPIYESHTVEGDKIRILFNYTGGGLIVGKKEGLEPVKEVKYEKLAWFAVAGIDKKWYWADAVIAGNTIVVSSDKVKKPVAVRYAYAGNPEGCNLYNKEGLPASPFRTDNW